MANLAHIKTLALDAGTPTAGAAWRSLLWGLQVQLKGVRPEALVYNFITRYSDGCSDAGHTGILTPMSPIFDQEPHWLNALRAGHLPAEFFVTLDGGTPVGAVQNLQKGDFVPGGSALSVTHPKPDVLSVVHAEGCTVALLVERTRVAAGAGRIPKQA